MSTRTAIDSPFSTPTEAAAATDNNNDDNDPTPTTSATTTTTTSNSFILTTATHNYVSRQAVLQNAKQIELRGRSVIHKNCQLRGDLAWLRLGRYVTLEQGVQLVPPPTPLPTLSRPTLSRQATKTQQPPPLQQQQQSYIPVTVGSYTHMGAHVYSQAAAIGSYCWIAPHVTLGPRVILKDGVIIQAEGCHIPPDTVIPPFTCIVSYCIPKKNNNNNNNKKTTTATTTSTTTSCTQQPQPPAQHQQLEWIELPPSIVVELQEQALQAYQAFSAATAAAKQKEEKDSLQ